jgi:hypothetical protein
MILHFAIPDFNGRTGKAYLIVHSDADIITVLPRREDRPAMLSLRGMSLSVLTVSQWMQSLTTNYCAF